MTAEESIKPRLAHRRTTWPKLVPVIGDVIFWEDGDAEKIGEGFFSTVFKFHHRPSDEIVAVKVAGNIDHQEEREILLREVALLKKLTHPNIIRYLGLCAKDGAFHPVLEVSYFTIVLDAKYNFHRETFQLINGGSLNGLLTDHSITLSWAEKIQFCRDIAKGMHYLHSNSVFHRDLKSRNCLIHVSEMSGRKIVVADFGLAREVAGDTITPRKMSVVGSAFSMAPELLNGELYNSKVDVFSFGILVCEIMARVDADPDELPRTDNFGLDLNKFSLICPDCPADLVELVQKCTEVNNPLSRPSFGDILETIQNLGCDVRTCMNERHPVNEIPPSSIASQASLQKSRGRKCLPASVASLKRNNSLPGLEGKCCLEPNNH